MCTCGGRNEWAAFKERSLSDEEGTSASAGRRPCWSEGGRGAHLVVMKGCNVRWGRVSALRFHLCNLSSIVRDYYPLFNYSDDIYQGQLYGAVSCREDGQSVLLLHLHPEEVCCWGCSSEPELSVIFFSILNQLVFADLNVAQLFEVHSQTLPLHDKHRGRGCTTTQKAERLLWSGSARSGWQRSSFHTRRLHALRGLKPQRAAVRCPSLCLHVRLTLRRAKQLLSPHSASHILPR